MPAGPASAATVLRRAAITLLLAAVAGALAAPAYAAPATAEFDWRMPQRYGIDQDGDGLWDVNPPATFIFPANWPVTLDACASDGGSSPVTQYRWQIAGPGIPGTVVQTTAACTYVYPFPGQGTFDVTLTVSTAAGGAATKQRNVVVKDWLIVSMGDSIGSGEGSPDIPAFQRPDGKAVWADRQCHRSRLAAASVAALALEFATQRTSVTFVHLACSGATITSGILGPYEGQEPIGPPLPPQLQQLATLYGQAIALGRPVRPVDALVLSIGANDMRFTDVVVSCVLLEQCHLDLPGRADDLEAWRIAQDGLAALNARYPLLTATLNAALPGVLAPDRVFVTEYNDPTRDSTGAPCDGIMAGLTSGITADEVVWAQANFLAPLNTTIRSRAVSAGWTPIGGIADAFRTHGYCAADHWIVQLTESLAIQGDPLGTMHPNYAGQFNSAVQVVYGLITHPGFIPGGVFAARSGAQVAQETARWIGALRLAGPESVLRPAPGGPGAP